MHIDLDERLAHSAKRPDRDFDAMSNGTTLRNEASTMANFNCASTRNGFHNIAWGRRMARHPRWLMPLFRTPTGFHIGTCDPCAFVWNPVGVRDAFRAPRPGVRRRHAAPRLCCATPLGSIALVSRRWGQSQWCASPSGSIAMVTFSCNLCGSWASVGDRKHLVRAA